MANRIKGITVEIGGDTTKLSKALEGVNKNIRNTQTQLKEVPFKASVSAPPLPFQVPQGHLQGLLCTEEFG